MEKEVVEKINGSHKRVYFALAGAGVKFLNDYMAFGGASKILIGANVPYNQRAFDKFIRNQKVDKYVSEQGARKLAVAAYLECLDAGVEKERAWGVGASCSIASTSPETERSGRMHCLHIAFHNYESTHTLNVILAQGRRRLEEEIILSRLIYNELAWLMAGVVVPPKKLDLDAARGELFKARSCEVDKSLRALCLGEPNAEYFLRIRRLPEIESDTVGVFCGSFNPIHDAHVAIRNKSQEILNCPVFLEFTINNAEKGIIDYLELGDRRAQIDDHNHIVTRASVIRDKISVLQKAFPNKKLVFVVGYDTWLRIWDPKYCLNNSLETEHRFLSQVQFLVFGRGGVFTPLESGCGEDLRIKNIEAENFRMDIASSTLRKQTKE